MYSHIYLVYTCVYYGFHIEEEEEGEEQGRGGG